MAQPSPPTAERVPWLFDATGLVAACVVLLVSARAGQLAPAFLAAALILLNLIARGWSSLSLRRLDYERMLSELRVFPGEKVQLTLRLSNFKPLPLAWVEVQDEIPAEVSAGHPVHTYPDGAHRSRIRKGTSLLWYRRAIWREQLEPRTRGIFRLGPVRLRSGDPFGLFPRDEMRSTEDRLIVYPRVVPLTQLGFPVLHPALGFRAPQAWVEDPNRQAGAREYRPGDPLRRIHWKASGRSGSLKVRVIEPTTTREIALILAIDGFNHPWEIYRRELFEQAISALASIALFAGAHGEQVGFFANVTSPVVLMPNSSPSQPMRILESMAGLHPVEGPPLGTFIGDALRRLRRGSTVVVAAAKVPEELVEMLVRSRRAGNAVTLISLDLEAAYPADLGVHVLQLPPYSEIGPILEGGA